MYFTCRKGKARIKLSFLRKIIEPNEFRVKKRFATRQDEESVRKQA